MSRVSLIDRLRQRGAEVTRLKESTKFTGRYRVCLPNRPEVKLTSQFVGGWAVNYGGQVYPTYSVEMSFALIVGAPLTNDLLTAAQRALVDRVVAAGDEGHATQESSAHQLARLGFLERVGKGLYRFPSSRDPTNPIPWL